MLICGNWGPGQAMHQCTSLGATVATLRSSAQSWSKDEELMPREAVMPSARWSWAGWTLPLAPLSPLYRKWHNKYFLCFTHTKIFKSTLFLCRKLNETKRNFIYFCASVGSTQQQCIIYGCRSWDGCRLVWGSSDRDTLAPLDHTLFTATWILVEK